MALLLKLLVIALLIWPLTKTFWHLWLGSKSRSWKPIDAEIVKVQLDQRTDDDGVTTYTPHITYKYSVQYQEFASSRISYGNQGTASYEHALRSIAGLLPGKSIVAHFDPSQPKRSTLIIGPPKITPIDLFVAVAIFAILGIILIGHSA